MRFNEGLPFPQRELSLLHIGIEMVQIALTALLRVALTHLLPDSSPIIEAKGSDEFNELRVLLIRPFPAPRALLTRKPKYIIM